MPDTSLNLATDAAGGAGFTRTKAFLPPSRFLIALTRRCAQVAGGGTALVESEFSDCITIVALSPLIFIDGFEP